jgi:hypothetical protein
MLIIRDAVWEQFAQASSADFVRRMRVHLRTFFPDQCNALGEVRTGQFIEAGIIRAREHGFVSERDVCKYIDLMCVFGHRFDRDERLPWARHILETRFLADPEDRMEHLHATAIAELREREAERERGRR